MKILGSFEFKRRGRRGGERRREIEEKKEAEGHGEEGEKKKEVEKEKESHPKVSFVAMTAP